MYSILAAAGAFICSLHLHMVHAYMGWCMRSLPHHVGSQFWAELVGSVPLMHLCILTCREVHFALFQKGSNADLWFRSTI